MSEMSDRGFEKELIGLLNEARRKQLQAEARLSTHRRNQMVIGWIMFLAGLLIGIGLARYL